MRIHRLEIEAFGPFAQPQHIDFDQLGAQGLFLLNGATGAGKTSVLDAICFALYGSVPGARQDGKRLRSDHAAPTAEPRVVCEFSARGRRFEVTRSPAWDRPSARGRKGFTTQQAKTLLRERVAGEWVEKSSRNDEAGAELSEVLGMDREQFTRVVMLPQGDFAAFLRSKASDRLDLLQKLFGTHRFESVERQIQLQAAEAARAVEDNAAELKMLLDRVSAEAAHLGLESTGPAATGSTGTPGSIGTPGSTATPGSTGTPGSSVAVPSEETGLAPEDWLEAIGDAIATECRRRREQADAAEARSARLAAALQEDQDKAQRHARLAAATQRRVLLELAAPRALEDRDRLSRHRRASVLGGHLDAVENTARKHRAAVAAMESLREKLASAGFSEATLAEDLEKVKKNVAVLEARLPDERRLEDLGVRIQEKLREQAAAGLAVDSLARSLETLRAEDAALLADMEPLEPLAGRREVAEREAAAAAEVVDLVARYQAAARDQDGLEALHADARTKTQDLRQAWLDLREERLANAAGELAAALADGDPCPVCGSQDHPHPAEAARSALSLAQDEETAALHFETSEKELTGIAAKLTSAGQLLAGLAAQGGAVDPALAEEAAANAAMELAKARDAAARLDSLRSRHAGLTARMEKLQEEHSAAVATAGEAATLSGVLGEQHAELEADLSGLRAGFTSLKARLEELTGQHGLLQTAAAAAREVDGTERAAKEAVAALERALPEAGFSTADEARRDVLSASDVVGLEKSLSDYDTEAARLDELFAAEDLVLAAKEATIGELPKDQDQLKDSTTEALAAAKSAKDLALAVGLADKAAQTVTSLRGRYLNLAADGREPRERARLLSGLADTLRGAGDNTYRMSLNSYVLAARLEQVAAAASERLVAMSDGRYTLRHTDAKAARGAKSGLGLEVVDQWTGQRRDTSTLSGGESFMASLSLALGLADVVQHEAGGVDIETLFVDEGFGSLDEQALEQVMDALEGLRDGGRVVGLVSHVAEMKQRISSQLQVVKGRSGSTVRVVEAMPV
ncbi:SMC family ATPase [Arthrobacter sp. TES]|uniref:AAA family ATPase n=1 Tax=Paenarthrobacter ureafaciens TaxID=37931 RepID=UPI00039810D0|nr:SMC family ATPase [Paenarthrobacter ureafaciens]AOY70693.1 Nuclease SbcCD subunit C [Arthrobacter sp. ZXY-2]ERI39249.1 chromosome segregation protein SMC [Arthrobacter sp. AK-YN10]QOI62871.1 SMC family ATPase [Arthrobacter sp. TES]GLU57728.1 nuclease SbcCD subunit C [Paenarthrobacter ureafaciens]GLU62342.1 nuclease SbcCD subunit C [Paenarthrobacter ureafaciens]